MGRCSSGLRSGVSQGKYWRETGWWLEEDLQSRQTHLSTCLCNSSRSQKLGRAATYWVLTTFIISFNPLDDCIMSLCHAHFMAEETEVWRGSLTCLKSQSSSAIERAMNTVMNWDAQTPTTSLSKACPWPLAFCYPSFVLISGPASSPGPKWPCSLSSPLWTLAWLQPFLSIHSLIRPSF